MEFPPWCKLFVPLVQIYTRFYYLQKFCASLYTTAPNLLILKSTYACESPCILSTKKYLKMYSINKLRDISYSYLTTVCYHQYFLLISFQFLLHQILQLYAHCPTISFIIKKVELFYLVIIIHKFNS